MFIENIYLELHLQPYITIGDIINIVSTMLYLIFTSFVIWYTKKELGMIRIQIEQPRIKELIQQIISPLINRLEDEIENLKQEKSNPFLIHTLITKQVSLNERFSDFEQRFPKILTNIRHYDELASDYTRKKAEDLKQILKREQGSRIYQLALEFNEFAQSKEGIPMIEDRTLSKYKEDFINDVSKDIIIGRHQFSKRYFWNKKENELLKIREEEPTITRLINIQKNIEKIDKKGTQIIENLNNLKNKLLKEYYLTVKEVKVKKERDISLTKS